MARTLPTPLQSHPVVVAGPATMSDHPQRGGYGIAFGGVPTPAPAPAAPSRIITTNAPSPSSSATVTPTTPFAVSPTRPHLPPNARRQLSPARHSPRALAVDPNQPLQPQRIPAPSGRVKDSKHTPASPLRAAASSSDLRSTRPSHLAVNTRAIPPSPSNMPLPPSGPPTPLTAHSAASPIPSPLPSPRWDSLPQKHPVTRSQTARAAAHEAHAYPALHPPRVRPFRPYRRSQSFSSESRDGFSPLPTPASSTNNFDVRPAPTAEVMPIENFSRPRQVSAGTRPTNPEGMRAASANHPSTDPSYLDIMPPNHTASWPRERAQSTTSNQSIATFASNPSRPSDSPRSKARQQPPLAVRPNLQYMRSDSSGPTLVRDTLDPLHHMASMPADELRSSYRSQLSVSTTPNTIGTERSSVATKSSSRTSMYGPVDDGFSVEDVMGMYEKGFEDDTDQEDEDPETDSRPATARSDIARRTAVLEAMTDPLPLPPKSPAAQADVWTSPPAPAPPSEPHLAPNDAAPIVRDSTAIFRTSGLSAGSQSDGTDTTEPSTKHDSGTGTAVDVEEEEKARDIPPPQRRQTNATLTTEDGRDRYGFRKQTQYLTREQFETWNDGYTEYLDRRKKKWTAYMKEHSLMTDGPIRFPPRNAKTKRFVRKGIPPEWRGAAWFYYAGGPAILAKHPGLYDDLTTRQAKDIDIEAIERDLHRTFPDNMRFRSGTTAPVVSDATETRVSQQTLTNANGQSRNPGETPMISSLRRVLRAFSIYNPKIGYCQSLNFLAGLLLLFVDSEEHAFWLLNIITRVYLPGTHETSLEGANVDLGVLMSSLRESMPAVFAKIGGELDGSDAARPSRTRRGKLKVETRLPPITLCMTAWFMSCFIGTLPIESTLRVWDVFFYEGSKTLFRIAMTIFKLGENEIKSVGDPMEIFQVVQTIPRKLIDANALMEACFKRRNGFGHISQDTIEQKRQERRNHVKSEKEKLTRGVTEPDLEVKRKGTLFGRRREKVQAVEVV